MGFSVFIPGSINQLANLIASVPNDKQVSFYKDGQGTMQAQTVEFSTVTQNTGYAFQYPDGSVIYSPPDCFVSGDSVGKCANRRTVRHNKYSFMA